MLVKQSFRDLKIRSTALLLFFNDISILKYCFTILIFIIPTTFLLEDSLYTGKTLEIVDIYKVLLFVLILALFFYVSPVRRVSVQIKLPFAKTFCLSVFVSLLSLAVCKSSIEENTENIRSFIGKNVILSGVIISKEGSNQYLVTPLGGSIGNVMINTEGYSVIHTGQTCSFTGIVVEPSSFEDFDYKRYLYRKGIYLILKANSYECQNGGDLLLSIRSYLENIIEKGLPEPESSLLVGILFGSKRVFTDEFEESLRKSGLSHIIAASGYNISLLTVGVDSLGHIFRGKFSLIVKITIIWIFTLLAGFSSSLVRASTMSTIYFIALLFGRDIQKGILVVFCLTVLILLTPFLIYDIGFLLSLSSTIGLIFLPKCFSFKSKFLGEKILPTLTCIIFTLPIVVLYFGKVSIISLVSNLIATPIIQSTIYWGLAITILNLLSDVFKIFYLIPYLQLMLFKYVVQLSSKIPMLEVNFNPVVFLLLIYAFLLIFIILRYPISNENYYIRKSKEILT